MCLANGSMCINWTCRGFLTVGVLFFYDILLPSKYSNPYEINLKIVYWSIAEQI